MCVLTLYQLSVNYALITDELNIKYESNMCQLFVNYASTMHQTLLCSILKLPDLETLIHQKTKQQQTQSTVHITPWSSQVVCSLESVEPQGGSRESVSCCYLILE